MNTYAKGYRREKEAIKQLEKQGWLCHRAKISRFNKNDWFGCFDICAIQQGLPNLWIQVKSNKVSKKETERIKDFVSKHFFPGINMAMIWIKPDRKPWTMITIQQVPIELAPPLDPPNKNQTTSPVT